MRKPGDRAVAPSRSRSAAAPRAHRVPRGGSGAPACAIAGPAAAAWAAAWAGCALCVRWVMLGRAPRARPLALHANSRQYGWGWQNTCGCVCTANQLMAVRSLTAMPVCCERPASRCQRRAVSPWGLHRAARGRHACICPRTKAGQFPRSPRSNGLARASRPPPARGPETLALRLGEDAFKYSVLQAHILKHVNYETKRIALRTCTNGMLDCLVWIIASA